MLDDNLVEVSVVDEDYASIELRVTEATRDTMIKSFIESKSYTNKVEERFAADYHYVVDGERLKRRKFVIDFDNVRHIL